MGDAGQWLTGEEICGVTLWNGAPLTVYSRPTSLELTITETDPGVRGDTASGGTKTSRPGNRRYGQGPLVRGAGRENQGGYPHG